MLSKGRIMHLEPKCLDVLSWDPDQHIRDLDLEDVQSFFNNSEPLALELLQILEDMFLS